MLPTMQSLLKLRAQLYAQYRPCIFPTCSILAGYEIEDNIVRYINVANSKNKGQATTIKMRYTRKTSRMDASDVWSFLSKTTLAQIK